ncbi:SMP-30/gluconolactonase/LRE family protein [Neolewinella sp.]|uniref:SMP-30/gluconolactonase/LRE family protein n=1 Tax=Neolewinella sp. TaxID=2993543 RepID=UPI003B52E900
MKYVLFSLISLWASLASAQQPSDREATPFSVGDSLGVRGVDGSHEVMSKNVKVFGAIVAAESCTFDTTRGLIIVVNRGAPQAVRENDAWVSLLHPDGSVHTPYWIGNGQPRGRDATAPPLTLNDPLGSEISGGILYIADRDGGTGPDDPTVAVIRRFDLTTGSPLSDLKVEGSPWINDLAIAEDGTIYATQTGDLGPEPDTSSWRVLKVYPTGEHEVLIEGAPLHQPNGIGWDGEGNLVVVNYGDPAVLTFMPQGELVRTEHAAQPGGDGLVILSDGTKYVSSVSRGGISRIRPGREAELIATGIPGAASMCYDPVRRQLIIPMTSQNGLAFLGME